MPTPPAAPASTGLLLTPRELAEKLDVSYGDVLRWTRTGRIPSIKCGNRYFYRLARVVAALRGTGPGGACA